MQGDHLRHCCLWLLVSPDMEWDFVMSLLCSSLFSLMERELYLETCTTRISLLLLCNYSVDLCFLHLSCCFFIIIPPVNRSPGAAQIWGSKAQFPHQDGHLHTEMPCRTQHGTWAMGKRFASKNLQGKLVTSPLSSDFLGAQLPQHRSPLRNIKTFLCFTEWKPYSLLCG